MLPFMSQDFSPIYEGADRVKGDREKGGGRKEKRGGRKEKGRKGEGERR